MTVLTFVFLVLGVATLVMGAESLVRGAARLAARTGMSNVVIGLTVVAFGTSAPELAVSIGDVLSGGDEAGSLAIGNVVGSNIANILLALGLAAAAGGALVVARRIVRIDVPIMIGVSVVLWLLVLDEQLGRIEGIGLTIGLICYITWTVLAARREESQTGEPMELLEIDLDPAALRRHTVWGDLGAVLLGLVLLVLGSQALVSAASDIAAELGVSDLVIGLTVVAIGTSLPEVATSVIASMRGQRDLAVGNAVGSNLFNILAVLGITAAIAPNPLPVAPSAIQIDIPIMIAVAIACLPIFANGHVLERWEGVLFLGLYLGYIVWLVLDASEHGVRESYRSVALYFVIPIVVITMTVIVVRGFRLRAAARQFEPTA
ncbi:MAG: calcium/sodium antiporter [Acidimicrobiia bacterium]|nr:calcium/sodium antiporter [Acidimicrobiia bacterium]